MKTIDGIKDPRATRKDYVSIDIVHGNDAPIITIRAYDGIERFGATAGLTVKGARKLIAELSTIIGYGADE